MTNVEFLSSHNRFMSFAFPDLSLQLLAPPINRDYLENHILGTLYGHCTADAVGLLTEFMSKQEAAQVSGRQVHGRIAPAMSEGLLILALTDPGHVLIAALHTRRCGRSGGADV